MNNPWQYDETAQIGTDYRDESEVRAYDERMQKLRNLASEAAAIAQSLALSSDSTVWEIGTGTGECAIALARAAKHVYATDVSPTMLEYARRKANQRGISNVTFADGGFLSGFRPLHPVDGIVTQLALHHLPDFWKSKAIAAIAACLRPQGRLYLRDVVFPSATVDYDSFFQAIIEGVRAHAGEAVAQQTVQHIKTEFSTLDWILEGMITRNGLTVVERREEGFLSVYVCEK
ncbi:MAG: methyltransferase domain-containing protein [Kiritimatiellae bacterium]|nr:methyltransferase domain-containing protein [Kiritimatiellia bacterium]